MLFFGSCRILISSIVLLHVLVVDIVPSAFGLKFVRIALSAYVPPLTVHGSAFLFTARVFFCRLLNSSYF